MRTQVDTNKEKRHLYASIGRGMNSNGLELKCFYHVFNITEGLLPKASPNL
jgi:hypothetical protein